MGATIVAPEVEPEIKKELLHLDHPKPVGWKERIRETLAAIFAGHEEFLGWTPD